MIQKPIGTPKDELQFTFRIRHQLNIDYDIIYYDKLNVHRRACLL